MSTAVELTARTAVYPGAFDPVHLGHLNIAQRASCLFDRVIVAVYERPIKTLLFSLEERVAFLRTALEHIPNTEVVPYSGLTVAFTQRLGAIAMIRGLRNAGDLAFETQLEGMNRHLSPSVETVFLLTAPSLAHLSSSLIKEVAAEGASLNGLVAPDVAEAIQRRYRSRA